MVDEPRLFGDVMFVMLQSEINSAVSGLLLKWRDMLNENKIMFTMVPDVAQIRNVEDLLNMMGETQAGEYPAEWDFPQAYENNNNNNDDGLEGENDG